ncbi:uncharacterized protein K02A2.6-like [Aethina tumida]|uniref:uncharacterized protein K02A2.6-like n=1 Tax=Aethina tumida TaxID=116153 RepID=UPI0021498AF4|nr:uncharacterized protein K02A2.6-like [Aethina tumida]
MFLVVVDAYSKWIEVKTTNLTTSTSTIKTLDELFSSYGSPITVVSDNAMQFTSVEFKTFLQSSGVKYHKLSAPYHPATNGQAERCVQTVKDALHKMQSRRSSLHQNLNEFLRQYRKAAHSTTGLPAQLFLERNIPITMDKWIPDTIITRLGDLHYEIDHFGKSFKRHVDQIRGTIPKLGDRPSDSLEFPLTGTQSTPVSTPRRVHFYEYQAASANTPSAPANGQHEESTAPAVPRPPRASTPQEQKQSPAPVTERATQAMRRSTRIRKPRRLFTPSWICHQVSKGGRNVVYAYYFEWPASNLVYNVT